MILPPPYPTPPPATLSQSGDHQRLYFPSIGPGQKCAESAASAASVASSRREGSRTLISLRNGVPWQKPMAASRCEGQWLRCATVSMSSAEPRRLRP